ncbi:hypothetical protein [Mesorhizobium sp. M0276]|uniref:hypothetical protein n=1 Tax=Mesorhizobium sp. M0276 TaxID=2956928 RepID=UPI0033372641
MDEATGGGGPAASSHERPVARDATILSARGGGVRSRFSGVTEYFLAGAEPGRSVRCVSSKGMSVYTLRHSSATRMLESGTIPDYPGAAGHNNLSTTAHVATSTIAWTQSPLDRLTLMPPA